MRLKEERRCFRCQKKNVTAAATASASRTTRRAAVAVQVALAVSRKKRI